MNTTVPAHREHTIETANGPLFVRDWGPVDGPVVVHHHGTPSCSLAVPGGWSAPDELGVRVLVMDRPGYGASPDQPGRTVGDAATWTADTLDALGVDRCAVIGTSGGGPHAAATAALIPDRVTRLCVDVGLGPEAFPGFDPAAGMCRETQEEIYAARQGEAALREFIEHVMTEGEGLDTWLAILPAADVEVLGRREVQVEDLAENDQIWRSGTAGWFEDDLALFLRPWGCDLTAITASTLLLYGLDDILVPADHGDAYLKAIGHGQVVKLPGTGHWMRDHEAAVLQWLVATSDDPPALLA